MKSPMKVKDAEVAYKTTHKKYTYQDYLAMPEDGNRYEIINGELIIALTPLIIHQQISINISYQLYKFLEDHSLGEFLKAPCDVVLSDFNVFQPDIFFIANENREILTEKNISGAPDVVWEIISIDTAYNDLIEKKELYAEFGVKEYWLVDPKKQWVEIFENRDGKFESVQKLEKEGIAKSTIISGWEIDLSKIFKA